MRTTTESVAYFRAKTKEIGASLNKESKKFDPHTLKPFDKIITRIDSEHSWNIDFFSCFRLKELPFCISGIKCDVIPYNDNTKHLIGTTDDVPDFYKYWED